MRRRGWINRPLPFGLWSVRPVPVMTSLQRRLSDALSRHRRLCAWLGAVTGGVFLVLVLVAIPGCSTPHESPPVLTPRAVVNVENHTGYVWRVAFDTVRSQDVDNGNAAEDAGWIVIGPRVTQRVELTAGIYRVRRELLTVNAPSQEKPPAEPGVVISFAGGHTYTWPLGTLFSGESGEAVP